MNWNKEQARLAVISGVVGALAVSMVQFLAFGATYGRLTKSVEVLEKRVEGLERKAMPGTKVGDLCLKLLDTYDRYSNRRTEVAQQLEKLGCYDDVPAAYREKAEEISRSGAEQGARAVDAMENR